MQIFLSYLFYPFLTSTNVTRCRCVPGAVRLRAGQRGSPGGLRRPGADVARGGGPPGARGACGAAAPSGGSSQWKAGQNDGKNPRNLSTFVI